MRLLLAIIVFCNLSIAATAEETFPYTATIESESANIRSGPAAVHYVTNQLKRGEKVEVYRHDPGGWYAIRPPQSEFSLVRAKYVLLNPNSGTGRITKDGTRAWVGTRLAPKSEPMWQVQLQRRDVVEVIGKQQVKDANGQVNAWYEIAPPAGEFRWIHESEFQKPQLAANDQSDELQPTAESLERSGTLIDANAREQTRVEAVQQQVTIESSQTTPELATTIRPQPFEPTKITEQPGILPIERAIDVGKSSAAEPAATTAQVTGGWQVAGTERSDEPRQFSNRTEPQRVNAAADAIILAGDSQPNDQSAERNSPPGKLAFNEQTLINEIGAVPASTTKNTPSADGNADPLLQIQGESFEDQYRQLELLLTMSILKPADQWQLEPLLRATKEFSKAAIDPDQQIMVSSLLRKIESFEKLQQQHQAVNSAPTKPGDLGAADSVIGSANEQLTARTNVIQAPDRAIDQNVRPAAFVENKIPGADQDILSDLTAKQSADEADGLDNSATAQGAIGTGVTDEPESIYDGTGWLNQLYINNGNARPAYVLQDENGNIIKTILPAPGVNLDRYLKQEVGVTGRRGLNRKYNLPHVTVDRVIVLERHR